MPGAQQHQEATPGRGAAAQDQLNLTGNARFRARATPHRHIRLNGIAYQRHGWDIHAALSAGRTDGGRVSPVAAVRQEHSSIRSQDRGAPAGGGTAEGPIHEYYLVPFTEPDLSRHRTEICWPVFQTA